MFETLHGVEKKEVTTVTNFVGTARSKSLVGSVLAEYCGLDNLNSLLMFTFHWLFFFLLIVLLMEIIVNLANTGKY